GSEAAQNIQSEYELIRLLDRLREAKILPGELRAPELLRWTVRSKREIEAARRYDPEPYPGRITLFQASENPRKSSSVSGSADSREDMGWSALTNHGVDHHLVPGSHFTMLAEPHVRVLANRLSACIEIEERFIDSLDVKPEHDAFAG
ncbi:MAG TPA: hypothetical protein VJX67_24945, partial [Blastocatellia bacterium]|nr:hypothetical protein [Blastocatellia bacterium]